MAATVVDWPADRIDFLTSASIEIQHLHCYACRLNDCIEERLDAQMFNLHGIWINFGRAVLIDGFIEHKW